MVITAENSIPKKVSVKVKVDNFDMEALPSKFEYLNNPDITGIRPKSSLLRSVIGPLDLLDYYWLIWMAFGASFLSPSAVYLIIYLFEAVYLIIYLFEAVYLIIYLFEAVYLIIYLFEAVYLIIYLFKVVEDSWQWLAGPLKSSAMLSSWARLPSPTSQRSVESIFCPAIAFNK